MTEREQAEHDILVKGNAELQRLHLEETLRAELTERVLPQGGKAKHIFAMVRSLGAVEVVNAVRGEGLKINVGGKPLEEVLEEVRKENPNLWPDAPEASAKPDAPGDALKAIADGLASASKPVEVGVTVFGEDDASKRPGDLILDGLVSRDGGKGK